jgi:hypothetical protein
MMDRIFDRNALATSVSIADRLPSRWESKYPLALPKPKMNGAAELTITRDGLNFKVAFSLNMGR